MTNDSEHTNWIATAEASALTGYDPTHVRWLIREERIEGRKFGRDWILDGAAVNVSMIAFDDGSEDTRILDGSIVKKINADLTGDVDVTAAASLEENTDLAFIGTQKGGPFDIPASVAEGMLTESGNPNGCPNSDVLKPWINGWDITRRSRGRWIIDFGTSMPLQEAAGYESPFEHVKRKVKPRRERVDSESRTTKLWWLHQRPRPEMRSALDGLDRYIATPRVSKHRVFAWVDPQVLPDSAVVAIARQDDYFFGVLHSRLHEKWSLRQGTSLEDRPRYTPTTTFETFPFPWPPGQEPADDLHVEAVAEAARELVEKRQAWLNPSGATEKELKKRTLTNLYNDYPMWLELAHRKLDEAVLDAYGWPSELGDEEILRRLLELNLERAE